MSEQTAEARWPVASLDGLLGPLEPGTLTVVCGGPATGKSSLLANLRIGLGRQGVDAYVQDFDGGYMQREVSILTGHHILTYQDRARAHREIMGMPGALTFCVNPLNMSAEAPGLLRHGRGVIIVDAIQQWDGWEGDRAEEQVSNALSWLSGLACRLEIPVVVGLTVRSGSLAAVPAGPFGWVNYADTIAYLPRRDGDTRVTEVSLLKHRTRDAGTAQTALLSVHLSGLVTEVEAGSSPSDDVDPATCPHLTFYANVNVGRTTDGEDGPVQSFTADITVKCQDCKLPFRFLGVPAGLSFLGPRVGVDGTELRAPIEPATQVQIHSVMRYDVPAKPPLH